MTPQEIRDAIAASPELQALAATNDTQAIADMLSAGRTRLQQPHMISERGILDKYAGGPVAADAVLAKLETFADQSHQLSGVVRRALKFLGTADGLDIGATTTQQLLTTLHLIGGVITEAEANNLKALALVADVVTHTEVGEALKGI